MVSQAEATTTPAPTPPSGPLPEVNLGQSCNYAHCAQVNSACVTKADGIRTCECVNKYLQTNSTFCKRAPDLVTKTSSFTFNVSTDFTGKVGSIPFDGLLEFEQNFFTLKVDIIPRDVHLKLTTSSDNVTLEITVPLVKSTIYALTMAASTPRHTVTDTDTVSIMVNTAPIPNVRNISTFVVQGTRRNTLVADVRAQGFEFENGQYTFSIESTDGAKLLFSVEEHTGRVVCRQDIIIQSEQVVAREYIFKVIATSGSSSMALIRANILVLKPQFEIAVNENEEAIFMQYELQSDSFTITPHGLPSDISNTNGLFQLMTSRDYEGEFKSSTFSLVVQTSQTIVRQTYISVTLNINDLNDEAPQFHQLTYVFDIFAGSYNATVIGIISSTDPDTVGQTYYTIEGLYKDWFSVDPSGTIISRVDLKKEQFGEGFSMSITASDGQQPSRSKAVVNVNLITIYPDSENLHNNFTVKIPEERPAGHWVTNVNIANYSNYRFNSMHAEQLFNLNSTTGQITTKRPLDRESLDATFTFFDVQARKDNEDQCTPVTLGRLIYELQDINDNYPIFSRTIYHGQVPENSPPNTDVSGLINIQASDADIGENAILSFTLTGNGSDYFEVVKYSDNNVKVKVKRARLDRELFSSYLLNLTATDNPVDPNARNSNSTLLNITILDENDNDPVCNDWPSTFYVLENVGSELLTRLTATDIDEGPNAEIMYSVHGGGWFFSVARQDGKVYINHPIDREIYDVIELTFEARDKGSPSRTCEKNATIYINDTNDNAPMFENGITYMVFNRAEDQDCSKLSIAVTATDPDKGINGTVEYSLKSSNFSIDKVSGYVTCNSPLDYELENIHEFAVVARDKGDEPMSASLTVKIQVLDINDNAPAFSKQFYNTSVLRGEWVDGKPILVLKVSDEDSGSNADIALSLNNYSHVFDITSGTTGVLRIKDSAPAAGTVYNFNITATDKGHPPNTNKTLVQVRVGQKEGDNPILFNTTDFQFDIVEETNYTGAIIGQVQAEVNVGVAKYSFVEGYEELFWINSSTGEIFCNVILDREEIDRYKLVVRALPQSEDDGGDVAIVTVNVRDINDHNPVFEARSEQLLFTLSEDAGIGSVISSIAASDPDEGINGTITYSILNKNEQTPFEIDEQSGQLETSGNLNRERTPSYTLTIQAMDGGNPSRSAVTNVTILVLDVNDNAPIFSPESYTKTIKENALPSTLLNVTVFATDLDDSDNGTVTYVRETTNVSDPTNSCPFSLTDKFNQTTMEVVGVMSVGGSIDYETTHVYECYVTAVDMSRCSGDKCKGRLTGTATVRINVQDVNDNAPVFQAAPYNTNVTRDSPVPTLITDVIKATDADSEDGNGIITYNITDGIGSNFFRIDDTSGNISIWSKLSGLDHDKVTLTIEASDNPSHDEQLQTTTTITIEILDDNPRPWFPKTQTMQILEEEDPDGTSLNMTALDRKDGMVTICNCSYELKTSEFSSMFTINKRTGEFRQTQKINRESTGNTLKIEIEASDDGDPAKSETVFVTINVTDINDNRPYFNTSLQKQTFSTVQTAPVGSVIGHVVSIDDDEDHYSNTSYNVVQIDERLLIHVNGTIVINKPLIDLEKEFYKIEFGVSVEDSLPLHWSSVTEKENTSANALVSISVHYSEPNEFPPKFTKAQYSTQLDFTSRKGTEIKPPDFKAIDKDGDNITYVIIHGNVRDILVMSADSGLMTLHYDLDSTIDALINLTITATDDALYPKTGTCQVLITLKDMEDTQCIPQREYSRLGEDSQQKATFMTLFGVITALLVLAVIAVLVSCYKWRVSRKEVELHRKKGKNYSLGDKDRQTKRGEEYDGLRAYVQEPEHAYQRHETRDFYSPGGVVNPAYARAPTGRNLRERPGCKPPTEPVPDYEFDMLVVDSGNIQLQEIPQQRREHNS